MNSDLAELIEHTVREKVKVSSNIEAFDRREQVVRHGVIPRKITTKTDPKA